MTIAVLNYETGEVIIKRVPENLQELDGDDILTNMGFKASNTEYMIVDGNMLIHIDTLGCTSIITLN